MKRQRKINRKKLVTKSIWIVVLMGIMSCQINNNKTSIRLNCEELEQNFIKDIVLKNRENINVVSELLSLDKEEVNSVLMRIKNVNQRDENYILNNFDTLSYRFNCEDNNNVDCIDKTIMDSIFRLKDSLLETKEGLVIQSPWNEFRKIYGYGGINKYSIPLFNSKKNVAIIKEITQGDVNIIESNYYLYKMNKEKWYIDTIINIQSNFE